MTNDPQSKTIAWFGSLPGGLPTEIVGLWRGERIPCRHPLDGVLENLQWFGKRFHRVLELTLFCSSGGQAGLLVWSRLRGTAAMVEQSMLDGAETAATVYDSEPIGDYFKRIGDDQIAGMRAVDGDALTLFPSTGAWTCRR